MNNTGSDLLSRKNTYGYLRQYKNNLLCVGRCTDSPGLRVSDQRWQLVVVPDQHKHCRTPQRTEADWQCQLRRLVHDAVVKRSPREYGMVHSKTGSGHYRLAWDKSAYSNNENCNTNNSVSHTEDTHIVHKIFFPLKNGTKARLVHHSHGVVYSQWQLHAGIIQVL